jgi:hypothetical protein
VKDIPLCQGGGGGMDPALGERGTVDIQAVERDVLRDLGEERAGAAACLQDAAGSLQACFFEEIRPQVTRPSGLLEVAPVPVHSQTQRMRAEG